MKLINICNRVIEYSFYAIFFLVPLVFTSDTSELFEFNKMWLTFGLTIIIASSWFIKMTVKKQLKIKRTPLDIPITLFLISQIISTIFSLDAHVSVWGYYSRFNGGLLSIISYIFLYYAFVSNLGSFKAVKRVLTISLLSGLVVGLWGLPSHFGYDPTCLMFRGTLDVSCWTADFQPKVRMFSSLGQPDWLAAYLAILIPISITMFLMSFKTIEKKSNESGIMNYFSKKSFLLSIFYLLLSALFYLDLIYTRSRSGIIAIWLSLIFFGGFYLFTQRKEFKKTSFKKTASRFKSGFVILGITLIITFFAGQPISQLEKFTLPGILSLNKPSASKPVEKPAPFAGEMGGTDSSKIRLIVWEGAISAWKKNPIFGSGVETFAYAYYKTRPVAHNLTSEWNFLYNKAHNEYLNYLATTGIIGLGAYLFIIGFFLFLAIRILKNADFKEEKNILALALISGYLSILVTNFFGFSVVMVNLYLFLIPAFILILLGKLRNDKAFFFPRNVVSSKIESSHQSPKTDELGKFQWLFIILITLTSLFLIRGLYKYWAADRSYALGYNLDRAGEYQQAYPNLKKAVEQKGNEPVYRDELSINEAVLAVMAVNQENASDSAKLANQIAQDAILNSNKVVSEHPNSLVFWKTRVRVFYTLSQADSRYMPFAMEAIKKASSLAPTDANVAYNLAVITGQGEDPKKAIKILENVIKLKPDYRDARYALGIFYHQQGVNKNDEITNPDLQKKAVDQMKYILNYISANDNQAQEALASWEKK